MMRKMVLLLASVALAVLLACGVAWAAAGVLDRSFNRDGRVLTEFNSSGRAEASDALVQPNGKIVAAGVAGATTDEGRFALARYRPNGSLDNRFGGDGKVTTDVDDSYRDQALAVARQPNGKIVAAGCGMRYEPGLGYGCYQLELVRYRPDGSLDESFGGDGKVTRFRGYDGAARDVVIQPDGKIVAVGAGAYGLALVRYKRDGSLDKSFGEDGEVVNSAYRGAWRGALQPDGKIVVLGGEVVLRYNSYGTLDNDFGGGDGVADLADWASDYFGVSDMTLQPDGKIVLAGRFYTVTADDEFYSMAVGRLNPDGSADKTFSEDGLVETPMGVLETTAEGVVVQPDGKIAAAGTSYVLDAQAPQPWWYGRFAVARYTSSGSLDESFGGDGIVRSKVVQETSRAHALVRQPDGKLVAVGEAGSIRGTRKSFALVRYLD
jgi:uncharacterized delta-60 repeat protein